MLEYNSNNLKHLKTIGTHAADAMAGFQALNAAAFAEGELSAATKELIAVAVAIAKQCPYCIDIHAKNARKAGVTDAQFAEAAAIATAINAGAAMTHATHVFE